MNSNIPLFILTTMGNFIKFQGSIILPWKHFAGFVGTSKNGIWIPNDHMLHGSKQGKQFLLFDEIMVEIK